MKCVIFFPYISTNINFDCENINPLEYKSMLEQRLKEGALAFNEFQNRQNGLKYNYNNDTQPQYKVDDTVKYFKIESDIEQMNGNDVTIDYLISCFQNPESPFVLICNFNKEDIEDNLDLNEELIIWEKESDRINNNSLFDEITKIKSLPIRDLKININQKSNANLIGCKIIDMDNPYRVALLINKIIFVTN